MTFSTPSIMTQVQTDGLNMRFIRSPGWTSWGRSFRREVRTRDGKVTGEYGWATMPEGILRQGLHKIRTRCLHPYVRITIYEADEFGYRVKNKIKKLNEIVKQPEKEEILIIGPIPPFLRNID